MSNTFIPYQKALTILEAHRGHFPVVSQPLEFCTGMILAEDLRADRDFPPFDRVTMDGIAIAHATFAKGERSFPIQDIAAAGMPQMTLQDVKDCLEVMTGAIMPQHADTVIRYEDLHIENGIARVQSDAIKYGQNIHFKGMDIPKGTVIVKKGILLSSAEINIAASIGKARPKVLQPPKVVVVSTGNELVPVSQKPALHQIRRSNVHGIQNTLSEWGLQSDLEHLPDDKEHLIMAINQLLEQYDALIFTGGVSKGKFDYLPEVLDELGVTKHFHKVQQRPGKPFWFGSRGDHTKIFALPGNPVSSFVCVYIYFRYWLQKSLGLEVETLYVELGKEVKFTPDLVYFLAAKLESTPDGKLLAHPVKGNGSGDFANLVKTDGFIVLPQEKSVFKPG
ncbi:MAG: molybdopterin molybdotransferase MoeA, partial [Flavobacteriaceae bacterium]